MTIVNITKEPLYGTVYWNGERFVYTPFNANLNNNDFFIYTKTINGVTTTYGQNISPSNNPPSVINLSLTANASSNLKFNISDFTSDSTRPFGSVRLKNVNGQFKGILSFDDYNIYYSSDYLNYTETLTYTVTDGQFDSSGTISLSVVNGYVNPPKKLSLNELLYKYGNTLIGISNQFNRFDNLYNTLLSYSNYWNTIDYETNNAFSNNLLIYALVWDEFYYKTNNYFSNYSTLESNSAIWHNNYLNITSFGVDLNESDQKLYKLSDILSNNRYKWDFSITKTNSLSSIILNDDFYTKLNTTYNTITSTSGLWDNSELNSLSNNNFNKFQASYDVLTSYTIPSSETSWDKLTSNFDRLSNILENYLDKSNEINYAIATINAVLLDLIKNVYISNLNNTQNYLRSSIINWSGYFNGYSSLNIENNSLFGFNFGENFSIEFWTRFSSHDAYAGLASFMNQDNTNGWQITFDENTNYVVFEGNSVYIKSNFELQPLQWYHIAVTRSSNRIRMFINGVEQNEFAITPNEFVSNNLLYIGQEKGLFSSKITGHISNLRIVKGSPVYTTNFTPSKTALLPITNTSLLTLNDINFLDSSQNKFIINVLNDVTISTSTPFILDITNLSNIEEYTLKLSSAYSFLYNRFNNFLNYVETNDLKWVGNSESILSSLSSNYEGSYNSIITLTSNWANQNLYSKILNSYNTTSQTSAYWNTLTSEINLSSNIWNNLNETITSNSPGGGSTTFINKSPSVNSQYKNINVFSNLTSQNISCSGTKTTVSTIVYTTSSYNIINGYINNIPAIYVNKIFQNSGSILNLNIQDNPILYVGSNKTVNINLSSGDKALNVLGNISSTGVFYNIFNDSINAYQTVSSTYENLYTSAIYVSSNFLILSTASSKYTDSTNFVLLCSTKIDSTLQQMSGYSNYYNNVTSNSARNKMVNDFVSLCSPIFGIDNSYRQNSAYYENYFSAISSINNYA